MGKIRIIIILALSIFLFPYAANAEEPISPKDKAIELAKKCVMFSDDEYGDVTAQEAINMVNISVSNGHIKNYIAIGWEAIDVSESIYTVVYKSTHEGKNAGYLFHVVPKDNIAWFVDLGKEKENDEQIAKLSVYLVYIKTLTTYTSEIFLQKINKILSACINEEDRKYLKQEINKWFQ